MQKKQSPASLGLCSSSDWPIPIPGFIACSFWKILRLAGGRCLATVIGTGVSSAVPVIK